MFFGLHADVLADRERHYSGACERFLRVQQVTAVVPWKRSVQQLGGGNDFVCVGCLLWGKNKMSWLGLNPFIHAVPLGALLFHLSPTAAVSLLDYGVELRSLNQRWLQEKSPPTPHPLHPHMNP